MDVMQLTLLEKLPEMTTSQTCILHINHRHIHSVRSSIKTMADRHVLQSLLLILAAATFTVVADKSVSPHNGDDTSCPTWKTRASTNGSCKCGNDMNGRILCSDEGPTYATYLTKCYCISYDRERKRSVVGACIYSCVKNRYWHGSTWRNNSREAILMKNVGFGYQLPLEKMELEDNCRQFNRTGLFCGDCMKGFSPTVFSYNFKCMNCTAALSSTVLGLLVSIILPQTILYVLTLTFRFSIASPKFNAFLVVSQVLGSPQILKLSKYTILTGNLGALPKGLFEVLVQFYSTLNLDFFRLYRDSTCIPGIDTQGAMMLEFIPALYPLLLAFLTLVLTELHAQGYRVITVPWYPFRRLLDMLRNNWNIQSSIVNVFATLLYLSFMKLSATALDLITLTPIRDIRGEIVGYWNYYQASATSLRFMGSTFELMILFLFLFSILPMLLILLYPAKWFRTKVLPRLFCSSVRSMLALKMFMDTLQGYYKDGTEPCTRDHRYMAGLYFLLRLVIYLEFLLTLSESFNILLVATIMAFALYILIMQPYKPAYKIYNILDSLMLINLALLFLVLLGGEIYRHDRRMLHVYMACSILLSCAPAGYFVVIVICKSLTSEFSIRYRKRLIRAARILRRKQCSWLSANETQPLVEQGSSVNVTETSYGSRETI